MAHTAMNTTLRRMKADTITVHGFRSSFRDWAGNETSYPRDRSGRGINLARMLANDTPKCLAGPAETPVSPAHAAVLLSAAL